MEPKPCELCGKVDNLYLVNIESSKMNVCSGCKSYGEVILKPIEVKTKSFSKSKTQKNTEPEKIELVKLNAGNIIKNAREKMGLNQEDFAKKINEKNSLIHNLESDRIKPNLQLAKKIERFLNIKLIDVVLEESMHQSIKSEEMSQGLTIGDLIKKKRN